VDQAKVWLSLLSDWEKSMSDQINSDDESVECSEPKIAVLSEQELAEISGGVDIFFSASTFEQRDQFLVQQTTSDSGCQSSTTVAKSSYTFASTFQFIGTGFESMNEALSFLSKLTKLFGR
jgi:bacteriocin-like protein